MARALTPCNFHTSFNVNFSETLKQTHEYKQNLKLQYNYISLFTYSRIHISSCIYIIFRIFSVIRNKSRILLIFDEIGYCRGYNQYTILVILAISILPFWMIRKKKKEKITLSDLFPFQQQTFFRSY